MDEKKLVKEANDVVTALLKHLEVEAEVETSFNQEDEEHPFVYVAINGDELGHLIGNKGVTLNSIQTVVSTILMRKFEEPVRIIVDINEYRSRRTDYLKNLAHQAMQQVVDSGQETELPPMTPYERRIVHIALKEEEGVTTESVGEGRQRRVIVKPKE